MTLTGTASNFRGPLSLTYAIPDATSDWGTIAGPGGNADCFQATADCYQFSLTGTRPAVQHVDTAFDETLSYNGFIRTAALHVGGSFPDVPSNTSSIRSSRTSSTTGSRAAARAAAIAR